MRATATRSRHGLCRESPGSRVHAPADRSLRSARSRSDDGRYRLGQRMPKAGSSQRTPRRARRDRSRSSCTSTSLSSTSVWNPCATPGGMNTARPFSPSSSTANVLQERRRIAAAGRRSRRGSLPASQRTSLPSRDGRHLRSACPRSVPAMPVVRDARLHHLHVDAPPGELALAPRAARRSRARPRDARARRRMRPAIAVALEDHRGLQ